MITLNGYKITPTIFPDKTSQVWNIPAEIIEQDQYKIEWSFENEAEIVHLLQLAQLVKAHLYIEYLPYARQDKEVSNSTTFALQTFIKIIQTGDFCSVSVLDPHSTHLLPKDWHIVKPENKIQKIIERLQCKVCYPDKGAAKRYKLHTLNHPPVIAEKVRNQQTGAIEGMKLDHDTVCGDYLIVDDICDGGRTFTEAANLLYKAGANSVYLYTTHGIYSKGTEVLKEAGIKLIFNYKGEVK